MVNALGATPLTATAVSSMIDTGIQSSGGK